MTENKPITGVIILLTGLISQHLQLDPGPTVVENLLQEAEAKIQWPEREGREAQVVVHRCVSKKQQILDEFGIRWMHFC